jgi:GNAT superfamily N-acetyltransferase
VELIRSLSLKPFQKLQIFRLWNNEYPAQLGYSDLEGFETYLTGLVNPINYILRKDKNLLAWAVAFDRDEERWFAIIVDSSSQKKGNGTLLLNTLKSQDPSLCGWVTDHESYVKSDGSPYPSPLGFYLKNGFEVLTDIRFENEKLSAVKIKWQRDN